MDLKSSIYQHIVTEGTHYEVGRALGAFYKHDTAFMSFMSSPFMGSPPLHPAAADKAMNMFEKYCPGVNQEIKGFADETGIREEAVVFYFSYFQSAGHCSQAALRTGPTDKSRTYHMRTYDFGWEDAPYNQLLLSTTRVTGKPAHIGFSLQLFGRYDGMNDEGLSVTTTSGRIRPEMTGEGFVFPGVVRALLDGCTTTKEAVTLLRSMPISDYRNFLVSDRHGSMALIEAAGAHKEIEVYDASAVSLPQLIVSTNHYTLPAMQQHNLQLMHNSQARQEAMYSTLWNTGTDYNPLDAMKQLAGQHLPEGVCCHHYDEGFGTLWSIVCDNALREAHICFGSPMSNPWRSFGFSDPPGINEYTATLPNEQSDAQFWSNIL
ncbi:MULTISPECIES: C45 family autoproteolytic acyltransferase/hydolase [Paenibacillus]|uniref:Peptidase C45 hydrolase domain-containing protein n=1 Tax=Paenibacillus borealis TaxID=160799 RepID=A0ABX3HAP3_PAEBO|nr:C45 family peptidase [Paenibacillus borealis]OMD47294.1 hypothetical protein BSK56_14015 [Paenibacillus borealis]